MTQHYQWNFTWHHLISNRIQNTQIIAYVHVAINLIYQGLNASYSRHYGTIVYNSAISNALSNCFVASTAKEFICKKCDKSLLAEKMPVVAVDARCTLQNSKQKICLYCKGISTKSILFDITEYGNNLLVTQIHEYSMLHHDSGIWEKCHNTILQESLQTCIICENTVAKKCLVGKHKYSLLKHTMPQIANIPNNRRHICNICYIQL